MTPAIRFGASDTPKIQTFLGHLNGLLTQGVDLVNNANALHAAVQRLNQSLGTSVRVEPQAEAAPRRDVVYYSWAWDGQFWRPTRWDGRVWVWA